MGDSIRYPIMKSVKDAAEIYGLSPAYIRRLCRTGKVRFVNAGHRWLVNMDSLARYFEAGDPGPAGAWMKPLAVSAGFLGGDILEHTEP